MESTSSTPTRIRKSAPFRKSLSMSQEDLDREYELEKIFTSLHPSEAPFSFSKTLCKALEIAHESLTTSQISQQPETKKSEAITQTKNNHSKIFGKRKN